MVMVSVEEATREFRRLLERVKAGEEVVICREGVPVARLSAEGTAVRERVPGGARWLFPRLPDLDGPLPDDVREAFGA